MVSERAPERESELLCDFPALDMLLKDVLL